MKIKKKSILMMIAVMALLLVGCRPSDEKLSEAEQARSLLMQVKQTAEDTYLDISDTTMRSSLDELALKEAEDLQGIAEEKQKQLDELTALIGKTQQKLKEVKTKLTSWEKKEDQLQKESEALNDKIKKLQKEKIMVKQT